MNYQRIYDQIVSRAKQEKRKKDGGTYYESHHILPKCLGGSNKKENLVLLTGREHFLCHWMLVRIYPENSKLVFAFWGMCNLRNKDQEERHTPSGRAFSEARELTSIKQSEDRKTFYQTAEGRAMKKKKGEDLKVFYQTKEGRATKAAQVANVDYAAFQEKRIANTDYSKVDYTARASNTDFEARAYNTDYVARTANTDYATKAANTNYELKAKKCMKTILQFSKDKTFIKEWSSGKEAGETLKINKGDITQCCRGRLKSAGGFIWKYVK